MVWPITGAKSYVRETGKSTKPASSVVAEMETIEPESRRLGDGKSPNLPTKLLHRQVHCKYDAECAQIVKPVAIRIFRTLLLSADVLVLADCPDSRRLLWLLILDQWAELLLFHWL